MNKIKKCPFGCLSAMTVFTTNEEGDRIVKSVCTVCQEVFDQVVKNVELNYIKQDDCEHPIVVLTTNSCEKCKEIIETQICSLCGYTVRQFHLLAGGCNKK